MCVNCNTNDGCGPPRVSENTRLQFQFDLHHGLLPFYAAIPYVVYGTDSWPHPRASGGSAQRAQSLCHNNVAGRTTPSALFVQLGWLCQSVSNSLFLPLHCYSSPVFDFFPFIPFVGSLALCEASKWTTLALHCSLTVKRAKGYQSRRSTYYLPCWGGFS